MDFPIGDHLDSNVENKRRDIPVCVSLLFHGVPVLAPVFSSRPRHNFS